MAAGHSPGPGSGIVVHSWEEVDIVVEGSSSHIQAQQSAAVVETHSVELVCHDMQRGKQSHVLGLVVVVES